jgi:hypothetical protein
MSSFLTLRQIGDNPGRGYNISGPTVFGKRPIGEFKGVSLDRRTSRKKPDVFDDLETRVTIEAAPSFVSRFHFGLMPTRRGWEIIDLGAGDGVFVNRNQVPRRGKTILVQGDEIRLCYSGHPESQQIGFQVEKIHREIRNYVLLIAHDGGNLKGVVNDIDLMQDALRGRGFRSENVTRLVNTDATPGRVISEIERIACLTTYDSQFVIHYAGHGGSRGISLGSFRNLKYLSPELFYKALENIRGKSAVILDSCKAGRFIQNGEATYLGGKNFERVVPTGVLVLAASHESGSAYESSIYDPEGRGRVVGRFTAAVCKEIKQHRRRVDLRSLGEKIAFDFRDDKGVYVRGQRPKVNGTQFFLVTSPATLPIL